MPETVGKAHIFLNGKSVSYMYKLLGLPFWQLKQQLTMPVINL